MARVCIRGLLLILVVLLASCGSTAAARGTGPVLIGLYTDLSSTGAREGNDALKGAELQVKEVNSSGGIDGRAVELRVLDIKQNPTDAVKAYIALAQDEGVCAVIGSAVTNAGLAVSPVADLVKVPLVFLGIDDRVTTPEMNPDKPEETGLPRQYSFMIQPSAAQVASSMASYAVEHFPMVRAAVLYDPSDPVSSMQEASFAAVVRKAGKIVAGSDRAAPGRGRLRDTAFENQGPRRRHRVRLRLCGGKRRRGGESERHGAQTRASRQPVLVHAAWRQDESSGKRGLVLHGRFP